MNSFSFHVPEAHENQQVDLLYVLGWGGTSIASRNSDDAEQRYFIYRPGA